MKRSGLWCLYAVALLGLSGCNNPVFDDESVIGPDLGRDGPFNAAHEVVMTQGFTYHTEGMQEVERTRRITITHGAGADGGVLINVFTNTEKPFLAGVSYEAFTPIIAETNDDAKTYWLVGFNASRTPDRSTYMLLRYPKDVKIAPGLSSDAFEYVALECSDLLVARRPADYYKPKPENAPATPEPAPDPAPEAGPCEFNSHAEADKMTPQVLKRYDEIKHYDRAPSLNWQTLHVEVK
ncbi:MAG TPA: hypothetical protein VG839_03005 [Asticcacaulis sp.]|nr:hypothetical protein [Asticcacaulis sp.]